LVASLDGAKFGGLFKVKGRVGDIR
jgi:hypothetical protein